MAADAGPGDEPSPRATAVRTLGFFGLMAGFVASIAVIGIYLTIPVFVAFYMRLERRERWSLVLPIAAVLTGFVYLVFERSLHINWPLSLLGHMLPGTGLG